jgi:lysophospholipase L1-like esterase
MWEDPDAPGRNGQRSLMPILKHYAPLDLIVFNLGINDLKSRFDQSAISVANGAKWLCQKAQAAASGRAGIAPVILLVAPPPIPQLTSAMRMTFEGAADKSKRLARHFSDVALQLNIHFLDAGEYITPSSSDPIHWDASAHQILGIAVADRVNPILGKIKVA